MSNDCIHCGLPADADCADHVQSVTRSNSVRKKGIAATLNQSIHPRVVNGRVLHPKSKTSARKRRQTLERAIAGISTHLEKHPADKMSMDHLASLQTKLASVSHV